MRAILEIADFPGGRVGNRGMFETDNRGMCAKTLHRFAILDRGSRLYNVLVMGEFFSPCLEI